MESLRDKDELILTEEDLLYDEYLSLALLSIRKYGNDEEIESEELDDNEIEKPSKESKELKESKRTRESGGGRGSREPKDSLTHFFSIPLNLPGFKSSVKELQGIILALLNKEQQKQLKKQNLDQIHITLGMLPLSTSTSKEICKTIFEESSEEIKKLFISKPLKIQIDGVSAFWTKKRKGDTVENIPSVIYLKIKEDEHFERIIEASNILITKCIEKGVLRKDQLKKLRIIKDKWSRYRVSEFHLTIFRVRGDNFDGVDMQRELEAFKDWKVAPLSPVSLDISTRFKSEANGFYLPFARLLF